MHILSYDPSNPAIRSNTASICQLYTCNLILHFEWYCVSLHGAGRADIFFIILFPVSLISIVIVFIIFTVFAVVVFVV